MIRLIKKKLCFYFNNNNNTFLIYNNTRGFCTYTLSDDSMVFKTLISMFHFTQFLHRRINKFIFNRIISMTTCGIFKAVSLCLKKLNSLEVRSHGDNLYCHRSF